MDLQGALVFEALPPDRRTDASGRSAHLERLEALRGLGVAAVNVPEIVHGHYPTVDPAAFGATLQQHTGVPAIVNKVTVHEPLADLRRWVARLRADHGIEHAVFVGGDSSKETYPGPALADALPRLADDVHAHGGRVGVVTIPTRRGGALDEPTRLRAKHGAGADFAISQILMEPTSAVALRGDLQMSGSAMPVLWSLAPVVRRRDIRFLEWLGVQFPRHVHQHLAGAADPEQRLRRSLGLAEDIATAIIGHARDHPGRPVGFCVEHVMASNVEPALDLLERLRDVCRSEAVAAV